MPANTETDDVTCTVIRETEKAFLLKTETDGEAWFPKSHVSFKRRNVKTQEALAEIPLWLLKEKGWDQ